MLCIPVTNFNVLYKLESVYTDPNSKLSTQRDNCACFLQAPIVQTQDAKERKICTAKITRPNPQR
jgi:hypothetical protein